MQKHKTPEKFKLYEIVKIVECKISSLIGRKGPIDHIFYYRGQWKYGVFLEKLEEHEDGYYFNESELVSTHELMEAKEFDHKEQKDLEYLFSNRKCKFDFREIVRIKKHRIKELIGKERPITYKNIFKGKWKYGIYINDFGYNNTIDYIFNIKHKKVWNFSEKDLESTGCFLTKEEFNKYVWGEEPTIIRVRVDPETGEGWVVDTNKEGANKKI